MDFYKAHAKSHDGYVCRGLVQQVLSNRRPASPYSVKGIAVGKSLLISC